MRKIIFLDIDGIINTLSSMKLPRDPVDHYHVFDQDCLNNLHEIIEQTDAEIVISSTWRNGFEFNELIEVFKRRGFKYPEKIIGRTGSYHLSRFLKADNEKGYTDEYHKSCPRGCEIEDWLDINMKKEKEYSYCILDDDSDMLFNQKDNFINTDCYIGLTKEESIQAIKILNTVSKNIYYHE